MFFCSSVLLFFCQIISQRALRLKFAENKLKIQNLRNLRNLREKNFPEFPERKHPRVPREAKKSSVPY